RDRNVTGVQTCALPISFQLRRPTPTQRIRGSATAWSEGGANAPSVKTWISARGSAPTSARAVRTASPSRVGRSRACAWPRAVRRSEERRVGKEGGGGGG